MNFLKRCFSIKPTECGYCGGSGLDPIDRGTCLDCNGKGKLRQEFGSKEPHIITGIYNHEEEELLKWIIDERCILDKDTQRELQKILGAQND